MTHFEFEDSMSKYFSKVDPKKYKLYLKDQVSKRDSDLEYNPHEKIQYYITSVNNYHSLLVEHAIECSDCLDNLLKYFEIREKVNYHDYPCFHLAYYTNCDNPCIENDNGFFSIITLKNEDGKSLEGYGIGFCPWCGIKLPTSYADLESK